MGPMMWVQAFGAEAPMIAHGAASVFVEQKTNLEEQEEEIRDRYLRRLSRRATIRKRLEEGQGLSNSRGGNWVQNTPNN